MMRGMGSMTGMNMGGRQLTPSDFKTISSPDLIHFLITIEQYDYNRQAARYLVVPGTTRFLIIGVQKKAGPLRGNEVWRVELTNTPGLIEQGRKKDNTLLRHHARQAHPLRQDAAPFETAAPLGQAA